MSKPKTRPRSISIASALLVSIAAALSFAQANAAQPLSDNGDHVVTGADLAFMNDAAPGGEAEVELGRLAAKSAESKEVRQFAQQMIEDHSKAGAKLKELARLKNVTLPPGMMPKSKQTMEKLTKLQGADFDRAYVKTMVQVHEKDVAAFSAFAKSATDADVKAFASATLPTLQHHLEMIRGIAKSMNVPAK